MQSILFKLYLLILISIAYLHICRVSWAGAIITDYNLYDDPTVQIKGVSPIGQTFKAEDKYISTIGFWLIDFNPQSGPISVNIELFKGEGIYGQFLGSATVEGMEPGFNGYYDADFSFVNLTPGEMYTAIVSSPNARPGLAYCPWRTEYGRVLLPDPYINGNFVIVGKIDYNCDAIFRIIPKSAPPIADAGPNQVAYAWIDRIAEVTLDGSASYDPDGNELTYLWRWSIDGNDCNANGVNPSIELPVGQYTIELVVNDGFADSEPNYVVITVVEPIEGTLLITPWTINRQIEQKRIMARLLLPEGITKDQIESISLLFYPGEVESYRQIMLGDTNVCIFAFFDRDEILDAIGGIGPVEVYVVGQLKTGQYFYGSDTMRIVNPGRRLLK